MKYLFADLELDSGRRTVRRAGTDLKLPNLSFKVLEVLVVSSPNLVSHDELIDQVWGENRVVSPENLSQRVALLRQSLGDNSQDPRYIETVFGQGFRLISAVEVLPDLPKQEERQKPGYAALAFVLGLFVLLLGGGLWLSQVDTEEPKYERVVSVNDAPQRHSIAVIPFSNLSPEAEHSLYAAGLHDELLNQLSKYQNLAVISRTSMLRYEGTEQPIPSIAAELNVDSVIEGSVRFFDKRMRVTVQLIDGESDVHLWSQTYDRDLDDILTIEFEIANKVAHQLNLVLQEEQYGSSSESTDSLQAFGEYVLGKKAMQLRDPIGIDEAITHFENATSIDPNYARAWIGLAEALSLQLDYGSVDRKTLLARQREVIDRALQLAPLSGEAWLADTRWLRKNNKIRDPSAHFKKSIELSPNHAQAHHLLGSHLTNTGRSEEALSYLNKALALDPATSAYRAKLSRALFYLGREDEALQTLYQGIEMYPDAPPLYRDLTDFLSRLGRHGEARYWVEIGRNLPSTTRYVRRYECQTLASLGEDMEAADCFSSLADDYPREVLDPTYVAYVRPTMENLDAVHKQLGASLEAMEWLALLDGVILNQNWDTAEVMASGRMQGLFSDEPLNIKRTNQHWALPAARVLDYTGRKDRSQEVREQVIELASTANRLTGPSYEKLGDVLSYADMGDRAGAVKALKNAYSDGWRHRVWILRSPRFEFLRGDSEWESLVAMFEADIEGERDWYQKHKERPAKEILELVSRD